LAKSPRAVFAHRQKSDGTYDSICGGCFAEVALGKKETDLEPLEAAHICRGFNLGRLLHPADKKTTLKRSRLRAA